MKISKSTLYSLIITSIAIFAAISFLLVDISPSGNDPAAEYEHGPHNGRMLRKENFALEITIFEKNTPPEFHVFAYNDNNELDPNKVELNIELSRLGDKKSNFKFFPINNYLKSDGVVREPHSFDVSVKAKHEGKTYEWKYSSYEGRTKIEAPMALAMNIKTEPVAPAVIDESISLTGRIITNPSATVNIKNRVSGIVVSMNKKQGDPVVKGEELGTIETDNLQVVSIKSPINGTVIAQNTDFGHLTSSSSIYLIADINTVMAEFHIFPNDINKIKVGQKVHVMCDKNKVVRSGTVYSLFPVAEPNTQTSIARVLLDNKDKMWRPGMCIQGKLILDTHEVAMAVKTSGLQKFRDFTVVFAKAGETYEVRMLELGKIGDEFAEVLSGIEPSTEYVTENSFLVKADIDKSSAAHDH